MFPEHLLLIILLIPNNINIKMEYLLNPFNISINPYPESILASLLGYFTVYGTIYYLYSKLDNIHYKIMDKLDNYAFRMGNMKTIIENKAMPAKTIQMLFSKYLDVNSLDRVFTLHYILEEKGDYETTLMDKNGILKTFKFNAWEQFKALERYFGKENFNLDENTIKNIKVDFGSETYSLSIANLRFISWLYYSGLSSYLMDNKEIKYDMLYDMNDMKLLQGNLFIRYQFYLIEYEKYLEGRNISNEDEDKDEYECEYDGEDEYEDDEDEDENENNNIDMKVEYNDDKYENDSPDISDIDNILNRYYVIGKLFDSAKELILGNK